MQLRAFAVAALFLIFSAVPSPAGEQLSSRALTNLFPGRFHVVVTGLINFKITARGDGSLSAVSPRGKKDNGRWSIRAGELCIKFNKWLGGRTRCTAIVQEAGWYIGPKVKFKRV
jgi:hypothetical protein